MKVLYLIRNEKNVNDVIDSIIISGECFSMIEYKFYSYLEHPDVLLPESFKVETILLDCIRVIKCKKVVALKDEIDLQDYA